MRIAVLTPQHFITGAVEIHEQRLSDFLGNVLTTALNLRDTAIARLSAPTEVLARHVEGHIPARDINAAFEQEGLAGPRPAAIVRKHPHDIFLFTGPVEIQGTHPLPQRA